MLVLFLAEFLDDCLFGGPVGFFHLVESGRIRVFHCPVIVHAVIAVIPVIKLINIIYIYILYIYIIYI